MSGGNARRATRGGEGGGEGEERAEYGGGIVGSRQSQAPENQDTAFEGDRSWTEA